MVESLACSITGAAPCALRIAARNLAAFHSRPLLPPCRLVAADHGLKPESLTLRKMPFRRLAGRQDMPANVPVGIGGKALQRPGSFMVRAYCGPLTLARGGLSPVCCVSGAFHVHRLYPSATGSSCHERFTHVSVKIHPDLGETTPLPKAYGLVLRDIFAHLPGAVSRRHGALCGEPFRPAAAHRRKASARRGQAGSRCDAGLSQRAVDRPGTLCGAVAPARRGVA